MNKLEGKTRANIKTIDRKIAKMHENLGNTFLRKLTEGDYSQEPDHMRLFHSLLAKVKEENVQFEHKLTEEEKLEREQLFQLTPRTIATDNAPNASSQFLSSLAADAITAQRLTEKRFYEALLVPEALDAEYQDHLKELAKDDPNDQIHSAVKAMKIKYHNEAKQEMKKRYGKVVKSLNQNILREALMNRLIAHLKIKKSEKMHEDPSQLDPEYLEYLFDLRKQTLFLSDDVKQVSRPLFKRDDLHSSMIYAQKSLKQNDAVPVTKLVSKQKIKKKLFALIDVHLTADQVRALAASIEAMHREQQFEEICLANNQVADPEFSHLLKEMTMAPALASKISRITYSNNEFGLESYKSLVNMLPLCKLQSLCIIPSLNRVSNMASLVSAAASIDTLQSLILPGLRVAENLLKQLQTLIRLGPSLKVLDLSWNEFLPLQVESIMKALGDNEHLQYLNLAMTATPSSLDIKGLTRFIKKPNLLHLDLSGMFVNPLHVQKVLKAVKKNRQLLAVHLDSTPALLNNPKLFAYIKKKLGTNKLQPKEPVKEASRHKLILEFTQERGKWFDIDNLIRQLKQNSETLSYFANQRRTVDRPRTEKLVLQRVIAHPQNICQQSLNGQWLVNFDCFVCQHWQLTMFLATSPPPSFTATFDCMGPIAKASDQHYFMDGVQFMDELIDDAESERDYINEVIRTRYTEEQTSNPILRTVVEMQIQQEFKVFKQEQLQEFYSKFLLGKEHTRYCSTRPRAVILDSVKGLSSLRSDITEQMIRTLVKSPFSVWMDYVKPATSRPDIVSIGDAQLPFVPGVRKDDFRVFTFVPKGEEEVIIVKFDKEHSVFGTWKEDTFATINNCISQDIKQWKVDKFCKDKNDYAACIEVFNKHYAKLKDLWVQLCSGELYPNIGWFEFERFCNESGIIDKLCTPQMVDRAFIAVNFDEDDNDDNPARELCRYEFMEIFVRIADFKFKQSKQAKTYAEAYERLLKEVFAKYKVVEWHEFRTEMLWAFDPNMVFELNKQVLTNLYNRLTEVKGKNWSIAFDKLIRLMTDSPATMDFAEAQFCFAMSKMTIQDDVNKREQQYKQMKFAEFIEYIARSANLKFKEQDATILTKIEQLLDLILPYYGLKRVRDGVVEVFDQSEADSVDFEKVDIQEGILIPDEEIKLPNIH